MALMRWAMRTPKTNPTNSSRRDQNRRDQSRRGRMTRIYRGHSQWMNPIKKHHRVRKADCLVLGESHRKATSRRVRKAPISRVRRVWLARPVNSRNLQVHQRV